MTIVAEPANPSWSKTENKSNIVVENGKLIFVNEKVKENSYNIFELDKQPIESYDYYFNSIGKISQKSNSDYGIFDPNLMNCLKVLRSTADDGLLNIEMDKLMEYISILNEFEGIKTIPIGHRFEDMDVVELNLNNLK